MDTIESSTGRIAFIDRFPLVHRIILALLGLLPLAAPYELLILPLRQDSTITVSFIPFLISLGALAVSFVFIGSALLGAEQHITFDAELRTIICRSLRGLAGLLEQRYPFGMVAHIEVRTHEQSDGPASHNIILTITQGREIEFGRFGSRDEAERHREEVAEMLRGPGLADKALQGPH
jgi:hypothetical protein